MAGQAPIEYRRVTTRDELLRFQDCVSVGFQHRPARNEAWTDAVAARLDVLDYRMATDSGEAVGTLMAFDQTMTVVGGGRTTARAVTSVTVLPTHRRRGILRALMTPCLDEAREAGYPVASLIAAEHGIYGRFGFGPATENVDFRIAVHPAWAPSAPVDDVRLVNPDTYLAAFHLVSSRLTIAGGVDKFDLRAQREVGRFEADEATRNATYRAVLRRGIEPVGVLSYTIESPWTDGLPDSILTITELLAVDASAERDLWAFAMRVDWVRKVVAPGRASDDLIVDFVEDPRTVQVTEHQDHLWLRPLDVPAMFSARTYAAAGPLVIDITDPGWGSGPGPAHGRFLIDTSGGPGTCSATDQPADLAMDVGEVASLWLSDRPVSRRVAVGGVRELTAGAAARADLILFSPRRPWARATF